MFPRLLVPALLLLASLRARADFVVTSIREAPQRGISLTADDGGLTLALAKGATVRLPLEEAIEARAVPPPAEPPAAAWPFEVELSDGSTIRGQVDAAPDGSLRVRSPTFRQGDGDLVLPIDAIRMVRRMDNLAAPGASRLVRLPESDTAYRLSGARVTGIVARFTATGVEIERPGEGIREVNYDDLAALFIDTPAMELPREPRLLVRAADGSMLLLRRGFRITAGVLTGAAPCGLDRLTASMERILALGFTGGAFEHLAEVAPSEVRRDPFFPLPEGAGPEMLDFLCPVRVDRSPDGRPIMLGGMRHFRGIGVRPRTELTWQLAGGWREFRAICGIDDEVMGAGYGRDAGTGSVLFTVLVDGKVAWESAPAAGGKPPQEARVKLDGAKSLTLLVTLVPKEKMPGGAADTPELDNAVWAEPLLVR